MYLIICIFKIQDCSLVDRSELHVAMEPVQTYLKVAKLANKGQFERYTVRNLPKFASVPELKQFLLENYSVELSPTTNHSFTVGYMSDGRTKCDIKQTNSSKKRTKAQQMGGSPYGQIHTVPLNEKMTRKKGEKQEKVVDKQRGEKVQV